jgi:LPXTG-motif cell wall-anchored protein
MSLVGAAIVALALGTVFAGVGVASSAAASDELQLSRDGIHYSPALDRALFDGAGSLVPGHEITASLWVKNLSRDSVALRVSVQDVTWSSNTLAGALTLAATVGETPESAASTIPAVVPQRCAVITSVPSIPAGASVRIDVRLAMADLVSSDAQSHSVALSFLVAMKDDSAGPFGASACNDDGVVISSTKFRTVAFTGGTLPVPLIIGGGLLIGVGTFLVARRRKRSDGG